MVKHHNADIAVLRLSNPVKIGPSAQTIALAKYAPPAGAQALLTGWGWISPFVKEAPIILQGINVTILSSDECTDEKIICAGSKEKTACKGDSGGALVVNNQAFLNDIAVLRLSNPVKIGPSAQTIALATYAPPAGAQALITGWGKISPDVEEKPIILQGINVTILSSDECSIFPWLYEKIICAGSKGKTACEGDSGGALVVNNQVVGVVSTGKCDGPTKYVSVPYYHQWILGAVDELYL
ncbi:trypsin alpha-3-like [Drosophila bipectinata]|uniref:trypsin alpha-3-like n=1 Tax=Drosophila bipectinata TaxID=42026 RepID=UPI001C89FAC7|nr:trypsin alpha-like [Drosophila bipectinata]